MAPPEPVSHLLSTSSLVADHVVLTRVDLEGTRRRVAYVVPATTLSPRAVKEQLQQAAREVDAALTLTLVNTLPLQPDGRVDERALASLPVCDPELIGRWQSDVRRLTGTKAVAIEEHNAPLAQPSFSPPAPRPTIVQAPNRLNGSASGIEEDGQRELSIVVGPPFDRSKIPPTLGDCLGLSASRYPTHGVTYIHDDGSEVFEAYPELLLRAQKIVASLRRHEVAPGQRVIFQLDRHEDFIGGFWACQIGGFVPVPIGIAPGYRETNAITAKIKHAWALLGKPIILTSRALAADIRGLETLLQMHGLRVLNVEDAVDLQPDFHSHRPDGDDLALMLLTSGSTGAPKAVTQTHAGLLSRTAAAIEMCGFDSNEVVLNWLPLDHVGGIVMSHFMSVFLGCRDIVARSEAFLREPLKWLDWVHEYRVTYTWAPNFAFGLVNDHVPTAKGKWDLSCLRFILNAGEAISAKVARRFLFLLQPYGLPETAMRPAWGMSETCSAVTYSDRFMLATTSDGDAFVQVGAPIPGFSMRIVDDRNRIVPAGTTGRLQVQGPNVTRGYYGNEAATRDALVDGWFNTGDLGVIRQGYLAITGRDKGIIIVNGVNYNSHEIEALVEELPEVMTSFTAACPVRCPETGMEDAAVFFCKRDDCTQDTASIARRIRGVVRNGVGLNPAYIVPVQPSQIPKTEIGKIQRALLSKAFERGEFDSTKLGIGASTGTDTNASPGLFERIWRPRQLPGPMRNHRLDWPTIVFAGPSGLGYQVRERLQSEGEAVILVSRGTEFARIAADEFQIDPYAAADYERLLGSISATGPGPGAVVNCVTHGAWTAPGSSVGVGTDYGPSAEIVELLLLVQALAKSAATDARVALLVVSSSSRFVGPGDAPAPWRAPLQGFMRTVLQEHPNLTGHHLDLPETVSDDSVTQVVRELRAGSAEPIVSYRSGQRLVPRFKRVAFDQESVEIPFKVGGLYVVAGGLGGIGAHVCRYLQEEFGARLAILGRSAPDKVAGSEALAELERSGAGVVYRKADIGQSRETSEAIEGIEAHFGTTIDGIIHAAGRFTERPLSDETPMSLAEPLAARVKGTLGLSKIADERPGCLLVVFSSVNGFFGGASTGTYSSAHSAVDEIMNARIRRGAASYSFAWTVWDETGMARGYLQKELSRSLGFQVLTPKTAMQAFSWALQSSARQVWIGLDASSPIVSRHVEGDCQQLTRPRVYYTGSETTAPNAAAMKDHFGREIRATAVKVPADRLLPDGTFDLKKLPGSEGRESAVGQPKTELEALIAGIWTSLLGVDQIDINDSFFDFGGTSISVARVSGQLSEMLNRDISITTFYRHPSVKALASALAENGIDGTLSNTDRGDRRRQKMLKRRRSSPSK